jgi:hypothetical protein
MGHINNKIAVMIIFIFMIVINGCTQQTINGKKNAEGDLTVRSLGKSSIGKVADIHVREARAYLRELMGKLYKRNPRELKKTKITDAEQNIARLFDRQHDWNFTDLRNKKGIEAVRLTFSDEYKGDRVFAFVAGLTSMVMAAYENKTDFYLFDTLDPQKLYNSARNIEIAVWKLGNDMDFNGQPYLYSNSLPGEVVNLSFERLFGKLIATQDNIAIIISGKTNRMIKTVIQRMATAVFLPI